MAYPVTSAVHHNSIQYETWYDLPSADEANNTFRLHATHDLQGLITKLATVSHFYRLYAVA